MTDEQKRDRARLIGLVQSLARWVQGLSVAALGGSLAMVLFGGNLAVAGGVAVTAFVLVAAAAVLDAAALNAHLNG